MGGSLELICELKLLFGARGVLDGVQFGDVRGSTRLVGMLFAGLGDILILSVFSTRIGARIVSTGMS